MTIQVKHSWLAAALAVLAIIAAIGCTDTYRDLGPNGTSEVQNSLTDDIKSQLHDHQHFRLAAAKPGEMSGAVAVR
jgi:hypothetical protein